MLAQGNERRAHNPEVRYTDSPVSFRTLQLTINRSLDRNQDMLCLSFFLLFAFFPIYLDPFLFLLLFNFPQYHLSKETPFSQICMITQSVMTSESPPSWSWNL